MLQVLIHLIHEISESKAIRLFQNFALDDRGCIYNAYQKINTKNQVHYHYENLIERKSFNFKLKIFSSIIKSIKTWRFILLDIILINQ